jgi:glycosyltransferase involved in cell wall biosynthesis
MKISIVTAVRNNVRTIEETLCSVAAQDHQDIEHVIVDGGSTDGTLDIIERYRDGLGAFVSERDRGVYDAMNKGLNLATGDVVGFLNADDIFMGPDVVSRIAAALAPAHIDACYADLIYVAEDDVTRTIRHWRSQPYRPGLFERGWMPAHPTFYVKRPIYERSGGFDLAFRLQADFELTLRLMHIHAIRTVYVPELWVRMRMGGMSNSSIRNVIAGNREAWLACRKNHVSVPPWFPIRKVAGRIPQFIAARLGLFGARRDKEKAR